MCISHITYEQNLSAFQISAEKSEDAQKALMAIDNALCERIGKMMPPLKVYLTRPEWDGPKSPMVEMVDADGTGAASIKTEKFEKVVQLKASEASKDDKDDWGVLRKRIVRTNLRVLEAAVLDFFSKMIYHRGSLRLKANVGIFVFNRYKWPKNTSHQPMAEFLQGMRELSTQGSLHKW